MKMLLAWFEFLLATALLLALLTALTAPVWAQPTCVTSPLVVVQ